MTSFPPRHAVDAEHAVDLSMVVERLAVTGEARRLDETADRTDGVRRTERLVERPAGRLLDRQLAPEQGAAEAREEQLQAVEGNGGRVFERRSVDVGHDPRARGQTLETVGHPAGHEKIRRLGSAAAAEVAI